jgi:hypothetical protein
MSVFPSAWLTWFDLQFGHFFSFHCPLVNTPQLNTQLLNCLLNSRIQSQSQSHIATGGQWVSKLWYWAPSGAHDEIFISVWQLRSCFRGAPSLTRGRVCLLYVPLPLPAQPSSGPSPLGLATVFYCLRFETSLFVASYDSQDHGGGIRPRDHTGGILGFKNELFYNFGRNEWRTPHWTFNCQAPVVTEIFC